MLQGLATDTHERYGSTIAGSYFSPFLKMGAAFAWYLVIQTQEYYPLVERTRGPGAEGVGAGLLVSLVPTREQNQQ